MMMMMRRHCIIPCPYLRGCCWGVFVRDMPSIEVLSSLLCVVNYTQSTDSLLDCCSYTVKSISLDSVTLQICALHSAATSQLSLCVLFLLPCTCRVLCTLMLTIKPNAGFAMSLLMPLFTCADGHPSKY